MSEDELRRLVEDMERTAQALPGNAAAMQRRGEREWVAKLLLAAADALGKA